jgi:hypothetical protein
MQFAEQAVSHINIYVCNAAPTSPTSKCTVRRLVCLRIVVACPRDNMAHAPVKALGGNSNKLIEVAQKNKSRVEAVTVALLAGPYLHSKVQAQAAELLFV